MGVETQNFFKEGKGEEKASEKTNAQRMVGLLLAVPLNA